MILEHNQSSVYCYGDGTSLSCPPVAIPRLGGFLIPPLNYSASSTPQPPIAKQIPYNHTYHGQNYTDEYHWLRDDKREDKEVLDHLKAENDYSEALLSPLKQLEDEIYKEISSQTPVGSSRSFVMKGEYAYYMRFEKELQYPISYRSRIANGSLSSEEVLLDLNKFEEKQLYLGGFEVSPNQNVLAYTLDTTGSEIYTLFVKDLEKGTTSEELKEMSSDFVWSNDSQYIFYTTLDDIHRPSRLLRHKLGSQQSSDKCLCEEQDKQYSVAIKRSLSEKYLFVVIGKSTSCEIHYLDLDNSTSPLKLFSARQEDRIINIEHQDNSFIVLTNRYMGKKYINNILLRSPISQESLEKDWSEVIPYDETHYITNLYPLENYLVLEERVGGYAQLCVIETNSRTSPKDNGYFIQFTEPVFTVSVFITPMKYKSTVIFYEFSSLISPKGYYNYNLTTRRSQLLQSQGNPNGFNSSNYSIESIIAPNNVPISLVYRKDLFKKDGSNPLHLCGYGSYGTSFDPEFSASAVSLMDRGFVYAIAHVRGGSEMGNQWYETEGKLLNKKNTFRDFSNAARHLVTKNYTSPGKLSIEGGSAGGLLVGTAINLNPGLFNAAILIVPFVDVINTMMDPTIPLTLDEYDEWGNPNNKEFFTYIKSYSPYDNLPKTGEGLPHLLVSAGLNDPRVGYWEPAKYVARLRAILSKSPSTNHKHIMQYIDIGGHSGSSGLYNKFRKSAKQCAFLVATAEKREPFL